MLSKYMMTIMSIISAKCVHKSLKCGGCISKPFRHYQPLEGTVVVWNAVFHSSPGENPYKMVHVSEVNLSVDSCLSWCV